MVPVRPSVVSGSSILILSTSNSGSGVDDIRLSSDLFIFLLDQDKQKTLHTRTFRVEMFSKLFKDCKLFEKLFQNFPNSQNSNFQLRSFLISRELRLIWLSNNEPGYGAAPTFIPADRLHKQTLQNKVNFGESPFESIGMSVALSVAPTDSHTLSWPASRTKAALLC